jgi:hypothetical protein
MYEVGLKTADAEVKEILQSGEVVAPAVDKHAIQGHQLLTHVCPSCRKLDFAFDSQRRKVTAG